MSLITVRGSGEALDRVLSVMAANDALFSDFRSALQEAAGTAAFNAREYAMSALVRGDESKQPVAIATYGWAECLKSFVATLDQYKK